MRGPIVMERRGRESKDGLMWNIKEMGQQDAALTGVLLTFTFDLECLSSSGFDFLFRTHPHALWQQTPTEPVLIP